MNRICREIFRLRIILLRNKMMNDLQTLRNTELEKKYRRKRKSKSVHLAKKYFRFLEFDEGISKREESEDFRNVIRMSEEKFNKLLQLVGPSI